MSGGYGKKPTSGPGYKPPSSGGVGAPSSKNRRITGPGA